MKKAFFEDWDAITEGLKHQTLAQSLLDIQQTFFPDRNDTNVQKLCEELVKPIKGWWNAEDADNCLFTLYALMKCNIPERLNTIGVRKWRLDIKNMIERFPFLDRDDVDAVNSHFDIIHSKLVSYERKYIELNEVTPLLELALWKRKIDESANIGDADTRGQCRVNCGADVIIPNVLPFLT